jgi:2-C-methyl-D-erythritol 4-phosphate cytidylyltransferase
VTSKALIIPAAGSGSRLQTVSPKPFIRLGDRTILEHTLNRFLPLKGLREIIVATSEEFIDQVNLMLDEISSENATTACVVGGKERQHSIYNALQVVSGVDLVMVHDAVRPFVKLAHIKACCRAAIQVGGAVLGVPVKDTIKRVDDKNVIRETPSRKYLWQTQTPQIFRGEILKEAYSKAFRDDFLGTDDASLVERMGGTVKMVEGERSNFKITYPLDLELAQLLITKE